MVFTLSGSFSGAGMGGGGLGGTKEETKCNAKIEYEDWTHVAACSFRAVSSTVVTVLPATDTFSLSVPFIVNTQPIQAGKEVILTWTPTANKRKESSSTSENAFDQILRKDKKERRMAAVN